MSEAASTDAATSWIRQLASERDIVPATATTTRRRAAGIVGDVAVTWAVDTAAQLADQLIDQVPDWPTDHSADEIRLLRQSIEAATLQTLIALAGTPGVDLAASSESVEFVRYYVRRGISSDHVIGNVHSTQSLLTMEILQAIDRTVPAQERMAATMEVTRRIAGLWDSFAHTVAVTYADERERWARSEMGLRLQIVDRVMSASRVNAEEAGRQLGYPLESTHVGSVLRVDTDVAALSVDVGALARRLASDAGCATTPLVLQRGHARADVWFPEPAIPVSRVAEESRWPAGVIIAFGEPGVGVDGFRSTYRQAGATCRVARLRGRGDRVTRYADVQLVSLLAADLDRAVAMVRDTLGRLATDEPKMQALRATLAAHLASGGNVNETSKAIHTHRNTVTYRLRQIDKIVRDPYSPQVSCALLLAANFPHLVLVPPHSG